MKELSIKEKAERYDELLKKLQKAKVDNNVCDERYCCVIDDIAPELKESEDERIRKWLIGYFHQYKEDGIEKYANGLKVESIIAWLEKQGDIQKKIDSAYQKGYDDGLRVNLEMQDEQKHAKNIVETWKDMRLEVYQQATGNRHEPNYADDTTKMFSLDDIDEIVEKMSEQKPIDKVEPKFKVGDLITNGTLVGKIDEIHELGYHAYFGDHYADVPDIENWHKWTIQDAKDGDVLATDDNRPFIFKGLLDPNHPNCPVAHGGLDHEDYFIVSNSNNWWDDESVKPATKEQRGLLFQAMHGAGYEWDAGEKELKKIKQNPALSEEDEYRKRQIIRVFLNSGCSQTLIDKIEKWIEKRLKKPQTTWKPSDEQIGALEYIIKNAYNTTFSCKIAKELLEQLKKLREE